MKFHADLAHFLPLKTTFLLDGLGTKPFSKDTQSSKSLSNPIQWYNRAHIRLMGTCDGRHSLNTLFNLNSASSGRVLGAQTSPPLTVQLFLFPLPPVPSLSPHPVSNRQVERQPDRNSHVIHTKSTFPVTKAVSLL